MLETVRRNYHSHPFVDAIQMLLLAMRAYTRTRPWPLRRLNSADPVCSTHCAVFASNSYFLLETIEKLSDIVRFGRRSRFLYSVPPVRQRGCKLSANSMGNQTKMPLTLIAFDVANDSIYSQSTQILLRQPLLRVPLSLVAAAPIFPLINFHNAARLSMGRKYRGAAPVFASLDCEIFVQTTASPLAGLSTDMVFVW